VELALSPLSSKGAQRREERSGENGAAAKRTQRRKERSGKNNATAKTATKSVRFRV